MVIYLQLLKALYGFMESTLLWYDLYANTLELQGFVVNPYDGCIEKITICGKQFTIYWCVGSNKVSHVDEHVNIRIIKAIAEHFGKLAISGGKITSLWEYK